LQKRVIAKLFKPNGEPQKKPASLPLRHTSKPKPKQKQDTTLISVKQVEQISNPVVHPLAQRLKIVLRLENLQRDIINLVLEDVFEHYKERPQSIENKHGLTEEEILNGDGLSMKDAQSIEMDQGIVQACQTIQDTMLLFAQWSDINTKYYDAKLHKEQSLIKLYGEKRNKKHDEFTKIELYNTTSLKKRASAFFNLYSTIWFYDEWFTLQQEHVQTKGTFSELKAEWASYLQDVKQNALPDTKRFIPYFDNFAQQFALQETQGNEERIAELLKRWNAFIELSARTRRVMFLNSEQKNKAQFAVEQAAFCLQNKLNSDEKQLDNQQEEFGSCSFDPDKVLTEDQCLEVMKRVSPNVFSLAVGANRNTEIEHSFETELGQSPTKGFLKEPIVKRYWELAQTSFDAIDIADEQASDRVILELKKIFAQVIAIEMPKGAAASLIPLPLQTIKEDKEKKKEKHALAQLRKENGTLVQNDLDFADATDQLRYLAGQRAVFCFQGFPRISFAEAWQLYHCCPNPSVITTYFQYLQDILSDTSRTFKLSEGESYTDEQLTKADNYIDSMAEAFRKQIVTRRSTARRRLKIQQYLQRINKVLTNSSIERVDKVQQIKLLTKDLANECFSVGEQAPRLLPKADDKAYQKYMTDIPFHWFQEGANNTSAELQQQLPLIFELTTLNYFYPPWLQDAFSQYFEALSSVEESKGKERSAEVLKPIVLAFYENPKWLNIMPQLLSLDNITGIQSALRFGLDETQINAVKALVHRIQEKGMKHVYESEYQRILQRNKEKMELGLQKESDKEIDRKALAIVGTDEAREMLGEQRTRKQLKRQAKQERNAEHLESEFLDVAAKLSKGKLYATVMPPQSQSIQQERKEQRRRKAKQEEEESEAFQRENRFKEERDVIHTKAVAKSEAVIQDRTNVLKQRKIEEMKKRLALQAKVQQEQQKVKRGGFTRGLSSSSSSSSFSSSSSSSSLTTQHNGRKNIRPHHGEGTLHYKGSVRTSRK